MKELTREEFEQTWKEFEELEKEIQEKIKRHKFLETTILGWRTRPEILRQVAKPWDGETLKCRFIHVDAKKWLIIGQVSQKEYVRLNVNEMKETNRRAALRIAEQLALGTYPRAGNSHGTVTVWSDGSMEVNHQEPLGALDGENYETKLKRLETESPLYPSNGKDDEPELSPSGLPLI